MSDSPAKPLAGTIVLDAGLREHPADLNVTNMVAALARLGARPVNTGLGLGQMVSRALVRFDQQRHLLPLSNRRTIGITMNLPARFIYPQALYTRDLVLYCFDCWEPRFAEWERFLRRNAFRLVLFSARDAAREMGRRLPDQRIAWLPEAIDPAPYDPSRSLADRRYDLVEFGRASPGFNSMVADHCRTLGYVHHYRKGDAWLFPTQDDLYRGLADARLVVALPQSLTHPSYAGNVETMSLRYLEIIASGALILGHCPAEMVELFGYDPVIGIDHADPCGQLDAILGNLDAWEGLRARNLARLHQVATWDVRARELAALL
ncbi:hypothetical protein [Alteraurantiacibacter buctensis]|uniref:Glycosyltransferase family 1 protein n=1 Tax=Alteraurantiacibacter buctensis TaxID=1503981 RepID=A0A844YZT3_9SPHN|nr:hypothetical protein [Alteraurantiacibacter buctensis]MXO72722.1 hypothetical protein [Alteraurantiacibacter buctensis]